MSEENVQAAAGAETTTTEQPALKVETKAPVVEQGKEAPATKDPKAGADDVIQYEATGDAKLDVALAFFGRAGLDAEHPAIAAAVNGDFGLLAAYLEEKGVQGWQAHLALAKEAHERFQEARQEGETKIVEAVTGALEKAGYSNEQWGEAIEWARQNAEPHELAELNEMLGKPFSAKIAVGYLTSLHREASGVEYAPAKGAIKEDAGSRTSAAVDTTPISRVEFAREAEKLAKKYGGSAYMNSPEYKALVKRRV